jgi:hypothetical protein
MVTQEETNTMSDKHGPLLPQSKMATQEATNTMSGKHSDEHSDSELHVYMSPSLPPPSFQFLILKLLFCYPFQKKLLFRYFYYGFCFIIC